MTCPLAIIFDLDGTLADTLEDIRRSVNETLALRGQSPLTAEQMRPLIGSGVRSMLQQASQLDGHDLDEVVERYRMIYRRKMLMQTRLYPGVADMLDAIERAKVPQCVLSNKAHEFTVPICEALLGRWTFIACRGPVDEAHRKPDPRMAIELAELMGCAPEHVMLVGDSAGDVLTARNAGMKSAAVSWGYRSREELLSARPDFLIDRPSQLLDALVSLSDRC